MAIVDQGRAMLGSFVRNALLRTGHFVSRVSDPAQVRRFVGTLAPFETNRRLIRVGGTADGGYLVPDDLQGVEHCFSPGVASTASFEADLAERGIDTFMADYSVDVPPVASEMFHFEKRFLGAGNDDVYMTLEAWIAKSLPDYLGDLILQMDIEGSEYDVIMETPESV